MSIADNAFNETLRREQAKLNRRAAPPKPRKLCPKCGHDQFSLVRMDETWQCWDSVKQDWGIITTMDTPKYDIRCKHCQLLQDTEVFES